MEEFKLEGYEIVRHIKSGGMGSVYEAKQKKLNRRVAIKTVKEVGLSDERFVSRFIREAQIMAKFNHPNIAQIIDFFEDKLIIVMEYIDGCSLKDLIEKNGMILEERALAIIIQAADALQAAHDLGVYHRDIKPDNIMLMKNDFVKVLDFGIARDPDLKLTATGQVFGTAAYMSPEQAQGISSDKIDGRSDIYSLGITLYQAVTGKLPFIVDTDMAYINKHINVPPDPPSKYLPAIDPDLEKGILKSLEKKPDDRYASAADFAQELRKILRNIANTKTIQQQQKTIIQTILDPQWEKQTRKVGDETEEDVKPDSKKIETAKGLESVPPKDLKDADPFSERRKLINPEHPSGPVSEISIKNKLSLYFYIGGILLIFIVGIVAILKFGKQKDGESEPTPIPTKTQVIETAISPEITPEITPENTPQEPENLITDNEKTPEGAAEEINFSKIVSDLKTKQTEIMLKTDIDGMEQYKQISSLYEETINKYKGIEKDPEGVKFFIGYGDVFLNVIITNESMPDKPSLAQKAIDCYNKAKSLVPADDDKMLQKITDKISQAQEYLK